ncbi:hypothetical protein ZOSMA_35G00270 [Zostera marina]|uniref:Uncharacterized protein n=1 Tax=Zostera marina TaxID=29655 RepID=A0A0K9P8J2_ZOSMR|nr:hypothetical protein ZOSMA_35G00270 [Zostera marina]
MSSLCYFCPNCICPSSQRPVKRYKSILRGIFPKSPGEEPNEKKIGKLCGYISKNPHRVEKITKILDRKCYNALRNENFYIASAVLCIYRRVLLSSREQMPRFADNLLNIIQTLLDQTRNDEMRILGCHTLFEFINSQVRALGYKLRFTFKVQLNMTDGTHMVIIENFIPKLCDLALELGNENRVCSLRCAGLQTLSSMVWFMGEHSHVSEEFDNVVSAILENHERQSKEAKDSADSTSTEYVRCPSVHKMITLASSSLGAMSRIPSWNRIINKKGELNLTLEETKNPSFWSRVCINNMAKLAKEATTIRRVIDSIFRYFDHENLWSSQYGPSLSVLYDIQVAMEKYGMDVFFL